MDFPLVDKNACIAVAMSGGVDSSTTAGLLKHNGYHNIFGVTLRLYDNNPQTGIACKDVNFAQDASAVAEHLQIPHHIIDVRETFYDKVINPFIESYKKGLTPAPCITCNREVKFGALYNEAKKLGADILVTGHYIKWCDNNKDPAIFMNQESIRDQSYFLAKINREVLPHIRFPLANLTKSEVRSIAQQYGLHVAQKNASNDICFAGGKNYSDLIKKSQSTEDSSGPIINMQGKVIGTHPGIFNYTIGQRKGLSISGDQPLYVVNINADTKTVQVGSREDLGASSVQISNINWLGKDNFSDKIRVLQVKVRASQQLVNATVEPLENNCALITFTTPVYGIAKGQVCAFYHNGRLMGGGDI